LCLAHVHLLFAQMFAKLKAERAEQIASGDVGGLRRRRGSPGSSSDPDVKGVDAQRTQAV
jgi:hypothetical protein